MRTVSRTGVIAVAVVALFLAGGSCVAEYNRLVRLDQEAQAQWVQVASSFQRRADLIPNLVAIVSTAAELERDTIAAVAEAVRRIGQLAPAGDLTARPAPFQRYEQAQHELGLALSRLMVLAGTHPGLAATQAYRDLRAELEATGTHIAVERMRYNDAARKLNIARATFPTSLVADLFGARFAEKQYLATQAGRGASPMAMF